MIAIPMPFVLALLLAVLLGITAVQREARHRPVIAFLAICIALMLVVGLRWSLDPRGFRLFQPVSAALVPPAIWLCFSPLRGAAVWLHALPAALVLALSLLRLPLAVDALLCGLFLGYGAALLRRGIAGPDGLGAARLGDAPQMGRVAAGGLLIFSAAVDLAVALDLGLGDGGNAARLVGAGGLLVLPLLGWATILMARQVVPARGPAPAPCRASPEDDQVLAAVDRILAERRLYRDPDLTLDRLARRLAIPARQVSGAINRKLGLNVSQAINGWRIREAMQQLAETDQPVTAIMLDCGFQTKSNFNREFRRVAGVAPSEWRRRARAGLTAPQGPAPESR